MKKINWGIIGCGDVTEIKSGPAFNKVKNSSLVAVMRRDGAKAKDYALRHHVPRWYDDAQSLIHDPQVNAIYIATPPDSHETYAIAAINAGKPVYVEKPMAVNFAAADNMAAIAKEKNIKLSVAHYRRELPVFKKIKQLLDEKVIGDILFARLEYYRKAFTKDELAAKKLWRVNPAIAGGGLFHDLAPHQLDLMYYFFGEVEKATGIATNQAGLYEADDLVAGNILFKNGIGFSGLWCFNIPAGDEKDYCEITGTRGKLGFHFFENKTIRVTRNGEEEIFSIDVPQHVQQPLIAKVVAYFLGEGENPCSGEEGAEVMKLIDQITRS